ncbi:MAG: hypothetical protein HKN76_17910 [Saprospiraceae bacterium]|nr:hypothetical protein [Saprospiraceae bacterium]
MSKVKKKSKRTSAKKSKKTTKKSKSLAFNFEAYPRLIPNLFVLVIFGMLMKFLVTLNNSADFTNELIASIPGLIFFENLISIVLVGCFGYFGWRYLSGAQETRKLDRIMLFLTFGAIAAVYIGSFTKDISPNGDNAEYLILAQSLVERGTALRLESPSETPNSLASLGLPLILAPIYKIWGFDIIKMKVLITALALLIFPLLINLFHRRHSLVLSVLLALICVTSPYLIGSSTDTMTETPYIFWSILSIILILKYSEAPKVSWKYLLLVVAGIIMTFLTRSVGIGLLAASVLYLGIQVPWTGLFKKESRTGLWATPEFRKFAIIVVPLLIGGIGLQIWQQSQGISQANMFLSFNIFELLEQNCIAAYHVLGQMLMSAETFRFQTFFQSSQLPTTNWFYLLILVVMASGFVIGIRKKDLSALYTVIVFLVIMVASNTPAEMVVIRYLSILLPFLIYYTYVGFDGLIKLGLSRLNLRGSGLVSLAGLIFLAQVLVVNLYGANVNITKSAVGNGPGYDDFIDVARWSKDNLPEDAYVMSIKPRLFYVISGKKGARLGVQGENYTPELEQQQLELLKREGITHLILDGISGSTRRNIYPIVQNNPDMFQTMYIGSKSSSSSVQKIIYKTE